MIVLYLAGLAAAVATVAAVAAFLVELGPSSRGEPEPPGPHNGT